MTLKARGNGMSLQIQPYVSLVVVTDQGASGRTLTSDPRPLKGDTGLLEGGIHVDYIGNPHLGPT